MSDDLGTAWELVRTGDVAGLMRHLRLTAEVIPVGDLAQVVGQAAVQAGFDDLAEASSRLAVDPEDPRALFDFGYACIERGAAYLAVPALRVALARAPDAPVILTELATALEDLGRHGEVVALLEERDATLRDWPDRYLLAHNAIMVGDLERAGRHFGRLGEPGSEWRPAFERVRDMLGRAELRVTPLDHRDLRGWHFVLAGAVLSTLSPFGFDQGMTGRYALFNDSYGLCLAGLHRLRLALDAADLHPTTVALLPDRSSQALGLAAARVLGVPAEPFVPDRPDTVVVGYDLSVFDGEFLSRLRKRTPGQVLYEHATCWTEPPAVTADISTLLRQTGNPPWGAAIRMAADGSAEQEPADDRSGAELAADILRADPTLDDGDGGTPPDPDQVLTDFVTAIAGRWPGRGSRDRLRSPGPVPSSRFL